MPYDVRQSVRMPVEPAESTKKYRPVVRHYGTRAFVRGRGVADPAGMHGHVDDLLCDLQRLTWGARVEREGTTGTVLLSAPAPLLALTGGAMSYNIHTVAVGTVEDVQHHETAQASWGGSASETFVEHSTSTP